MKNLNKTQKSQIAGFIIITIFFIWLLIYFLVNILPNLRHIENEKNITLDLVNNIDKTENLWISYEDFELLKWEKSANLASEADSKYIIEILNNIDADFYEKNLVNSSWEEKYLVFLDNLFKKYSTDQKLESDISMLSNILPIYSNGYSGNDNKYLSDFAFINYIESILETFNISYNNFIWISELILLKDYMVWQWVSSLEENIFYIPLTLDIVWDKAKILEFFYYIDNVWKINIGDNWININSSFDKDFATFSSKVLKSQEKTKDYNIFNNQVFDVESIEFKDYIDSSFDVNEQNVNLVNNIRNRQWNQKFEARVILRFYVKWLPIYKIENDINEFLTEYSIILWQINGNLWNENLSSVIKIKLADYAASLEQINNNLIIPLASALWTREDLERLYMDVLNYRKILKEYSEYIENINK